MAGSGRVGRAMGVVAVKAWTQYDAGDMHRRLLAQAETFTRARGDGGQAIHCPYYVPLEGRLGADWGVIVNPESFQFGRLVFEHDDCGCPETDSEDGDGWGRHADCPSQDGDMWWDGWRHEHDDGCDSPCASEEWT